MALRAEIWPLVGGTASRPLRALALAWDGPNPPAAVEVGGIRREINWEAGPEGAATALLLLPLAGSSVEVTGGGAARSVPVPAARPWEIFLVPHSHVDIGYTEFPDILADAHGDYIAQALDLMAETDGSPEPARYRWICETAWTVEQFLRRHPGREAEFVRRLREGRMELTALQHNSTALARPSLVARSVEFAREFARRHGAPLVSACNYDVNGFPWCLPDVLAAAGVRYLDTAINEVRSLPVRPRPSPFRWYGPGGGSVLLWHSPGYLAGNEVNLHISAAAARDPVARRMAKLEAEGYPHHAIQFPVTGVSGDSMPPSAAICAVVEEWNRTWLWPRLRLATTGDWFRHLEAHWPAPVPETRQAWPDWWADGNGSALAESALIRETQARLEGLERQRDALRAAGLGLPGLDAQYGEAWRRAGLFCEHTWGAYETGIRPEGRAARGGWHWKAAHAYAAAGWADSIALEQMVALATAGHASARAEGLTNATLQKQPSGYLASADPPGILVFNPLPEARSELVRVHVPGHMGGPSPGLRQGRTGAGVAAEVAPYPRADVVNRDHRLLAFVAELPAGGHAWFPLAAGDNTQVTVPDPLPDPAGRLQGRHFRLEYHPATGAIRSLRHLASGRDLAAPGSEHGLGQPIRESLDSPEGRLAFVDWDGLREDPPFRRAPLAFEGCEALRPGPGGRGLAFRFRHGDGLRLRMEIWLRDHAPRVDLEIQVEKTPEAGAEALYHAFPLLGPGAVHWLEAEGGAMRPWADQVPGTSSDWHAVQDWFAAADGAGTVVVATPDVPLVQCGGLNAGAWLRSGRPANGLFYSWAMNNYWFTNFPTAQGGARYAYSLAYFPGPFDPERARAFGAGIRHRPWAMAVRLSGEGRRLLDPDPAPSAG